MRGGTWDDGCGSRRGRGNLQGVVVNWWNLKSFELNRVVVSQGSPINDGGRSMVCVRSSRAVRI